MNCRHVRRDLSAYLDGELEPRRHADLRAHLDGCAGCSEVLRELRALHSELRSLPTVPLLAHAPAAARARPAPVWRSMTVAAAAVELVVLAVWVGAGLSRHTTTAPMPAIATPPVPQVAAAAGAAPSPPGARAMRPAAPLRHPRVVRRPERPTTPPQRSAANGPADSTPPPHKTVPPAQQVVAVYEAGLTLAEGGSVGDALRTLCREVPPVRPPVEDGAFAPQALAAMGNLSHARVIYEGRLTRLTGTADELPIADRARLAACDKMLVRDQPTVLAMYLAAKERELDE